jgi:hypothetical protein
MIQNFTWNNGTLESPIVLTPKQISALVSAGDNPDINASVKGVIKSSASLYKHVRYALNRLYGNDLTLINEDLTDVFKISAPSSNLLEGNSMSIKVDSSTGMSTKDLQYVLLFDSIQTDGEISEDTIKSRISIENGILKIAPAQENSSWSVSVTVRAYPLYEDISTSDNYEDTTPILCKAIAITDFTMEATEFIQINSSTDISYTILPSNNTKTDLIKIEYAITSGNGSISNDKFYSSAKEGETTILATCTLPDNTKFSSSVKITTKNTTQSTITIWNGGVNGGISDTESMVSGDTVADKDLSKIQDNVILWIRNNSHLYLCKYIDRETGMKIKQLDDNDKTKYSDGTDAPIDGTPDSDGIIRDVMLRLPTFYFKCTTNSEDDNAVDIIFSLVQDEDNSFHKWDTNKLIAAYEAVVYRDGSPFNPTNGQAYTIGDTLYSISGVTPTRYYSTDSFKKAARARNSASVGVAKDGFQIIDYDSHVIMALLYYAYYGGKSINCQKLIGYGTGSYPKITGQADSLGINDSISENTKSINFWGLENWWGDLYEWTDNIITSNNTGLIRINDYQGNAIRYLQVPSDYVGQGKCISKMILNDSTLKISGSDEINAKYSNYPDLFWKELDTTDYSKYYADYGFVGASAGLVAPRGGASSDASGGVGYLLLSYDAGVAYAYSGSRLVFCGTVTDITGTAEADSF